MPKLWKKCDRCGGNLYFYKVPSKQAKYHIYKVGISGEWGCLQCGYMRDETRDELLLRIKIEEAEKEIVSKLEAGKPKVVREDRPRTWSIIPVGVK